MRDARTGLLPRRLADHASSRPDGLGFRIAARNGRTVTELTWGTLWSDARATAAAVPNTGRGVRVGLACQDPRDFLVGLASCLVSGRAAVPLPVALSRRSAPRLTAILRAARLDAVLIGSQAVAEDWLLEAVSGAPAFKVANGAPPSPIEPADVAADDVALIQFTSGSTGEPKGIALTHANIVANAAAIAKAYDLSAATRGMSWLPLHHDMGLIGHVLVPMWLGCRSTLMDPLRFLQRPLGWLRMAGEERATITSAPNFAYEMCVRAAQSDDLSGIDLSSLTAAVCGGEPVLPETMERFLATFANTGFRRGAFAPSYGLAEATLLVASGRAPGGPGYLRDPDDDDAAVALGRRIVDLGPPVDGVAVRVVDDGGEPVPDGVVGEIEIAGDCVGSIVERDGTVSAPAPLRTGDFGYITDGRMAVTGRKKDMIIIRGQNVYPTDVESAALAADGAVAPGGVAAVGVSKGGTEALIVLVEIDRRADLGRPQIDSLRESVSSRVSERVGFVPAEVIVLKFGTLPRTSSGKVRRAETAKLCARGEFATTTAESANGEPLVDAAH